MEYRLFPRSGERISIIGMGSSVIGQQPEEEIIRTVKAAVAAGINYFDLAAGHAPVFAAYGKALQDCREQVFLQIHFGADYTTGEYGWTTDLPAIRQAVRWQLDKLRTDYIDIGFIHCLDEEKDLMTYQKNGVLAYILDLKKQGIIRHIGLSTHTPSVADQVLDMGIIDVLMFSINPSYDYQHGDYAIGSDSQRQALYRRCQREQVAITVMKPFCGGQLLDAAQSPFGEALTRNQCLQYALDKPAVITVLPGFANESQLADALTFLDASEEEKDYSVISSYTPDESRGKCVYCRHCHPCPAGLDIALINKYYDLACLGDELARQHYLTLDKTAADCTGCGHCTDRCPFHVPQAARMGEIAAFFA